VKQRSINTLMFGLLGVILGVILAVVSGYDDAGSAGVAIVLTAGMGMVIGRAWTNQEIDGERQRRSRATSK
jgi:multisubunit Na+/H+ antiporter MnhG subunit